jgi:hypothetical protein
MFSSTGLVGLASIGPFAGWEKKVLSAAYTVQLRIARFKRKWNFFVEAL